MVYIKWNQRKKVINLIKYLIMKKIFKDPQDRIDGRAEYNKDNKESNKENIMKDNLENNKENINNKNREIVIL
jgi:hypothetical protein